VSCYFQELPTSQRPHFLLCYSKDLSSYAESHGIILNYNKLVCMTFTAKSAQKHSHPITDIRLSKCKIC